MTNPLVRAAWTAAAVMLSAPLVPLTEAVASTETPDGVGEALELAFRFATATPDETDRQQAQQFVVQEYLTLKRIDDAMSKAARVEGWRQGVAYAEVAAALAGAGRIEEAKAFVRKAQKVHEVTDGWQGPRIASHMTAALNAIGRISEARTMAKELAVNDRDFGGRTAATVAVSYVRGGRFDDAMKELHKLDAIEDVYISWWRTVGFLDVADMPQLTDAQRKQAIAAARTSAETIPGWHQAEAYLKLSKIYREDGLERDAKQCLENIQPLVDNMGQSVRLRRASLLANLAREWGHLGRARKTRRFLEEAESLIDASSSTERAIVYARVASAYRAMGDMAGEARLLDKSLRIAENQVNPRPRATAMAAVCRVFAEHGISLTGKTRQRVEALLAGLESRSKAS